MTDGLQWLDCNVLFELGLFNVYRIDFIAMGVA
jgi:hypothetical protein